MSEPLIYMLDTNTVSYSVSGRSPMVRSTIEAVSSRARLTISAVSEAEIRFGLQRKPEALRLAQAFEDFFNTVEILPWESATAKVYARLRFGINSVGKSLTELDMMIAAHALSVGAALVSHDHAFRHLEPWLQVVDWATDL